MDRVNVVSSVIEEIGYSASSRTLEILFKSGAIYLYYFVPQAQYDALMAADSKGTYFNKKIKGVYEHHRIAEPYDDPSKTPKPAKKPGGGRRTSGTKRQGHASDRGASPGLGHP
jgi:KTSC domain